MRPDEIHVIYGSRPLAMVQELLAQMKAAEHLDQGMQIALKPNLVVAKPSSAGATTTPAIVEGIIQYLLAHNLKHIAIMEGSWVGDQTARAFKVCGYEEISRKYQIPLIDLQQDAFQVISVRGESFKVCQKALAADYLINIPVLKAHCQTLFTCALKNLKGCIPNSEKRRYHALGLHKPIAYLSQALKAPLNIVDALNGDLTFEEGGNPVRMDRIIAGQDAVLIDTYCASLIGYAKEDIAYIRLAEQLGTGQGDLTRARILEYNQELKSNAVFQPSRQAAKLAARVNAAEACSACFGGLIHALNRLAENGKLRQVQEPIIKIK